MSGSTVNPTRRLAEWADSLTFDAIPSAVVDRVSYLLLDFLGVSIYALRLDSSRVSVRFATEWGGAGPSTILGSEITTHPSIAALVNGIIAHGPELDDVTEESSLHPGVVNFSALLSMAEAPRGRAWNGHRFIEACVAAYEITIRVGNAVNIAEHYAKGFHPTATAGTFGAAAGVAKFLGLDARGIQMALGLAGSQAAGSLAYLQNGSWGKRFNAGWAAHSGVMAALMAKSGMTGPDDILAGPNGFLQGYTEHPLLRRLTEGLGKSYAIEEVAVKPYGCCRYSHSAIDGALALRGRGLVPSQIREMQILLPRPALLLVGEPEKLKRAPETPVDAQFSVHYATLVALENGHAEPEDFVEPKLFVQRHSEIRSVHAKVSPECDSVFPQHWATRLIVETKDGRHWEEFVTDPKGSQYNPMTWEEVVSKFKRLTSSLPPSTQEELINGCRGLKDGSVHPYSIIKRLETSEARQ